MSADDFSPDSSDAVAWDDEYAEAIVARQDCRGFTGTNPVG